MGLVGGYQDTFRRRFRVHSTTSEPRHDSFPDQTSNSENVIPER